MNCCDPTECPVKGGGIGSVASPFVAASCWLPTSDRKATALR